MSSGEAIHRLAPCPERIAGVAARFGEACHATLERVTMQARYSWNCSRWRFIEASRAVPIVTFVMVPSAHNHLHVIGPARGKQC